MSTLNILCVICCEFYSTSDLVYSTGCGHLFHKKCLDRWLSTSRTCPECRHQYNEFQAHRVFLNFSEPNEFDDMDMKTASYPEWRVVVNGPYQPLQAGVDLEGNQVYVARCPIKEDLVPANYIPAKNCAYLPWNCSEHKMPINQIEYLVDDGTYSWVPASDGEIPSYAVIVGYATVDGGSVENLYTGRAQYRDITYPGKVHPSHKVLYMPCEGREDNINTYEVLVRIPQRKDDSVTDKSE